MQACTSTCRCVACHAKARWWTGNGTDGNKWLWVCRVDKCTWVPNLYGVDSYSLFLSFLNYSIALEQPHHNKANTQLSKLPKAQHTHREIHPQLEEIFLLLNLHVNGFWKNTGAPGGHLVRPIDGMQTPRTTASCLSNFNLHRNDEVVLCLRVIGWMWGSE